MKHKNYIRHGLKDVQARIKKGERGKKECWEALKNILFISNFWFKVLSFLLGM